nr:LuxR C-terminal-related transcriptional regulator [Listeria grayi]
MAERLFISAKTVEVHKSHIMKKLEMKKFSDLLRFCVKEQLIDL